MDRVMAEKMNAESIVDKYAKHFGDTSGRKIAIYGIGVGTKIILERFKSDNILGLMDELRTGETIYGKKIISLEEAYVLGVNTIVIIARAANVNIIYRRISEFCKEHSILVFDLSGKSVGIDQVESKRFDKYETIKEELLKSKIDLADVVSFDVFDTLIMRRTLYPRDIFELAEQTLFEGFAKQRVRAELNFYAEGKLPNIYEIYESLTNCNPDTELALESEFLITRESMCEFFKYAIRTGKTVYLVSDMYLPNEIMHKILNDLGICIEKEKILVSCDYGVSKSNGLFEILRGREAGRFLHIGDDIEADIQGAVKYGIDDTFHVERAIVMFEDSFAADLLQYDNTLQDSLFLGEFISSQLNDPFLFSKTKGKFAVKSNYEMAYTFIAPLVCSLFRWLADEAKKQEVDLVLLSSRDGYILNEIYNLYRGLNITLPNMSYFYTSRAVAVLAGTMDDEDILHAARLAYTGKVEEMLKSRFLLTEDEILKRGDIDEESYILQHREAILRHAEVMRNQYKEYINKLNIPKDAKVGFFDFISSGTCQKSLANIVEFNLIGLYLSAINFETAYKSETKIIAMYDEVNEYEKPYSILENLFLLENIITSFETTLSGFTSDNELTFIPEKRTKEQLTALQEIHTAILDYALQSYRNIKTLPPTTKVLPDLLLNFLKSQYCETNIDYFVNEALDDEFCNRKFKLSPSI